MNNDTNPARSRPTSSSIRVRSFVPATEAQQRKGLVGFISVEYGGLVVDSLALRQTVGGRYALSFPSRTDNSGQRHPYYRPIDSGARAEIEREILWQLGEREDFEVTAGGQP